MIDIKLLFHPVRLSELNWEENNFIADIDKLDMKLVWVFISWHYWSISDVYISKGLDL